MVAQFVPTFSVRPMGGPLLVDNQLPPVDYGMVGNGTPKTIRFVVKNAGATTLKNLRLTKSGLNPSDWQIPNLAKTTLKPGESVNLAATLKSSKAGPKSATITLSSSNSQGPFRIRVMGSVALSKVPVAARINGSSSVARRGVSTNDSSDKSSALSGSSAEEKWVSVTKDGLVRHIYRRPTGDKELPVFWISLDGSKWRKASLVKVIRLSRGAKFDEYLAVFPPPHPAASVVLVSDVPPKSRKP